MSEKKSNSVKQKPEHEIRCGAVTASIYLRQSNCGYPYLAYSLTRGWRSQATGKQAQGTSFFEQDEADLTQAASEAAEWIRRKNAEPVNGQQPAAEK